MGHKFDPKNVARLDDPARLGYQPVRDVLGLLELNGDETVVDYGAGVGYLTLPLAAALPRGRVVAVDMSAELLAELGERLRGRANQVAAPTTDSTMRTADGASRTADGAAVADERVELIHTTDNQVPLPDGSADAIVAVNLWHEIYDEPAALDELRRLLATAGRLAIVDWATVERPVGPCVDHVLSLDQALEVTDGMDLAATAVHPAGSLFPYHYAIVARPRA
jgi:ubiquinone/menaquinone biosynthesis C-methylase UbiE